MWSKITQYVTDSVAEFKLVDWPTRSHLTNLTILTILTILIFGALVGGLDIVLRYGFTALFDALTSLLLKK